MYKQSDNVMLQSRFTVEIKTDGLLVAAHDVFEFYGTSAGDTPALVSKAECRGCGKTQRTVDECAFWETCSCIVPVAFLSSVTACEWLMPSADVPHMLTIRSPIWAGKKERVTT